MAEATVVAKLLATMLLNILNWFSVHCYFFKDLAKPKCDLNIASMGI